MIHARIDLVILNHRRAYEAGPEAMGVWLFAVGYARDQETDGFVPAAILHAAWGGRTNAKLAARLVAAGLLTSVPGGYVVEKYAEKNETKVEIDARRKAEADRKAAYRSRGTREYANHGTSAGVPLGQPALSQRDTRGTPAGVRDTEPEPEPEPESESEKRDPPLPPLPAPPPVDRSKSKRKPGGMTRIPTDWQPAPGVAESLAKTLHLRLSDVLGSVAEFRDYWQGEGKQKTDWNAVFRNRVRQLVDLGRLAHVAPNPLDSLASPSGPGPTAAQREEFQAGMAALAAKVLQ